MTLQITKIFGTVLPIIYHASYVSEERVVERLRHLVNLSDSFAGLSWAAFDL